MAATARLPVGVRHNILSAQPSSGVMSDAASVAWMIDQDKQIAETVQRERGRLRSFIRRRVADEGDAEDILQEVFYELVEAYRSMKPVEQVGAWLFRVARNRITDLFRKRRPQAVAVAVAAAGDAAALQEGSFLLAELLPSQEGGPDADYARGVLLEELAAALDELSDEQRETFVAHEIEGRSFKEISAATGVGVNTLLSRKHYAVLHLRRRLRAIYNEFANP
jgi:RNA polymerase sigma factor (sigma-70 family)